MYHICYETIQFNSIKFIDQLRALKGQQENCTYMNKQWSCMIESIARLKHLHTHVDLYIATFLNSP